MIYSTVFISAFSGLLCFLVFNRFEPWHPLWHFATFVITPVLINAALDFPSDVSDHYYTVFTVHLGTLVLSVIGYRLSPFHPLAKYPGPLPCKISKAWMAFMSLRGKQYLYYQRLHRIYGDIVRIGPNEISILDPSCIAPLLGQNELPKGPAWLGRTVDMKVKSLVSTMDLQEHARRRRPWNRAFSTAALKHYEPIIADRATQLTSALSKETSPIDLSKWISYFAYDFMSDMAFGGGSEMMRDGDHGGFWHLLDEALPLAHFLGHVPWIGQYYVRLPGVGKSLKTFRAFSAQRAILRKTEGSLRKDIFHYLNNEDGVDATSPSILEVISNGALAIIAGSDTTATTLCNVFYLLLTNPKKHLRLQNEIDNYLPARENVLNTNVHQQMPYLNAVINEALRLYPPVPSGTQRGNPSHAESRAVGPYVVPAGTAVIIPPYALHRDSRYFSPLPDSFVPERWLSRQAQTTLEPELFKDSGNIIHDMNAFIPFSFGPSNCVGKNLAYQEMRMVICLFMKMFNLAFAPTYDPSAWERSLEDYFVMRKGELMVALTPKEQVQ